jgi:hypothetical protein
MKDYHDYIKDFEGCTYLECQSKIVTWYRRKKIQPYMVTRLVNYCLHKMLGEDTNET